MRNDLVTAVLVATALVAAPAAAQTRSAQGGTTQSRQPQPLPPTPAAQRALAGADQPDVLLDIPNLSVEQITLDVANLQVHIALDARLANLLKLTAGADASVDKVKLDIKGIRAQATLIVRLDNVRAIIDRTLTTLDKNPQIISGLYNTVDNTVGTVGGVANNAVGTVGGVTSSLLRNGQVLDLARSGLSEVSRTVNGAGQTVRQVRNASGGLIEVVTDSAGKILSSQPVGR
jgi:hypothetical protein